MSSIKRRRYKRYEIKLAATLFINNAKFIQCMIRDYCSGGMFLESQQHNDIGALLPQQKAQVLFTVQLEHGSENFSLDAKIVHIRTNGIGIAFEKISEAAFDALQKTNHKATFLTSSSGQHNQTSSSKQKNLKEDLNSLLQEVLPALIRSFYNRTEARLTEASERVENLGYNDVLLDAITNLKMHKETLFENFSNSEKVRGDLIFSSGEQEPETETTSLSLIEKPDFEDWLNLSVIVRNQESVYESQLDQLQKKIAFVIDVNKELVINPASPELLCESFRDALTKIEENTKVIRTLYNVFEETLAEFLPDLYTKMDIILVEHGAPKKIVEENNWKKIKPGARQSNTDYPQPEKIDNVSAHNQPSDEDTLLTAQPIVAAQENVPVASISSVASNLLHLLRDQSPPQNSVRSSPAVSQEYSAREISMALSQLQQQAADNGTIQHSPDVLQKQLLNTLGSISSPNKQLSNSDRNNLDVYECLFETLYNDMLMTKETQSYLERLHLPIMDQAMQDPTFLESNNHPARNIVNHLAWLESAVKDNKIVKNTRIRQTMDLLIEQINQEALENTEVFTTVEQQLNEITESVNKSISHKIKRITEVYEGKQKLAKARQTVQKEISHQLADKKIPKIIITLLEAGWQHLLVIAKLNEDKHAYQNYLSTIYNLNGWLSGANQASQTQADTALQFIDSQLHSVCTNTFLHSNIMRELNGFLLEDSIPLGSDAIETAFIESDENLLAEKVQNRIDEVDQLRVGEWLTFLLKQEIEPLKLVWIGDLEEEFVFVDRSGIKKLELERENLAEMIRSGAANRIESLDMPVMDRATNIMLQKMHEKLVYNATHDPITTLCNRKEFINQLKRELARLDDAQHALCNIEIQDFRIITNSCGLSGGDALLKQLADLLKSQLNKEEIIARLDDKTFSVLMKNCPTETTYEIAKTLQSKLTSGHFKWQDKSYAIAVSFGIVPLLLDKTYDINSILQKVDSVTISAKKAGRNHIQIYQDDDEALKSQFNMHEWAGRINQVFAENRLFLRCQKIASIDPDKHSHTHYEILLGVKDENDKVIAPDDFIPAVERCRRMSEVDRWVVLSVFDWIEQHQQTFEMLDGFSINLSGESMNSEEFLVFLKRTLNSCKVPLQKITFEITETVAADSFLFVQKFIKQIKRFNCKFSLDDFGSGYSSYSYLKSLDVDYLKIDGAFVKDIVNNSTDVAIVKSMNEIAHSLKLETIAEYVENDDIRDLLKEIGVDYVQGWGVQKPILIGELA